MGGDGEEIGLPRGGVTLGLWSRVDEPRGDGGERERADKRLEVVAVEAILERAACVVDRAAGRSTWPRLATDVIRKHVRAHEHEHALVVGRELDG